MNISTFQNNVRAKSFSWKVGLYSWWQKNIPLGRGMSVYIGDLLILLGELTFDRDERSALRGASIRSPVFAALAPDLLLILNLHSELVKPFAEIFP
jgi:hypothetical protein